MNTQAERNRSAFNEVKEDLEATDFGRTVLLHDGEVVAIYNDAGDAYAIGCEKFELGNFTTQEIGKGPICLGIHTLCISGIEP